MKIRCETKKLHEAFQAVQSIIPPRSTKPILANVKMLAKGNEIQLLATDLEVGIRRTVTEVEVLEAGACIAPAARTAAILREAGDTTVELTASKTSCHISYEESNYDLVSEDPDEFPDVPDFEEGAALEIERDTLREMIHRTAFAAAREKTRYALHGVLFKVKKDNLTMVATDGRRLAYVRKKAAKATKEEHSVIVPSKAMRELEKLTEAAEEPVKLRIGERSIIAKVGHTVLSSRLVEGQFPDYEAVIPKDCDKKMSLGADRFLSAIRRAALFTGEEARSIRLHLTKGKMLLLAESPDLGKAEIELELDYKEGEVEIGFNPDFLADALRVVGPAEIKFELKDSAGPGLLREGKDYIYVVMPVSLD